MRRNQIRRRSGEELKRSIGDILREKPGITDYAIGRILNISFATRKKYCGIVRLNIGGG